MAQSQNQGVCHIIIRAVSGDDSAITELLWHYYDRLVTWIDPLVPASLRGQIEAEDILQETFAIAWQKIPALTVSTEEAFYCWLSTIAKRKLLDRVRAHNATKRQGPNVESAKPVATSDPTRTLLDLVAADGRSPSSAVAGQEAESRLKTALVELAERHRKVLQLRYLEGLTVAAAAESMNCSHAAIHMLTGRAIKKLRSVMGNESRYFSIK